MTDARVDTYLAALRDHLGALPEQEREELLADLAANLEETAADTSGPLAEVLGEPEAFARELLVSSGTTAVLTAPSFLTSASRATRESRAWRHVGPWLKKVQPAWWVLRGYVAAVALAGLTGGSATSVPPRLGDSAALGLLLVGGCVVGSVWLGERTTGRRRAYAILPNALLAVAALALVASIHRDIANGTDQAYPFAKVQAPGFEKLPDGVRSKLEVVPGAKQLRIVVPRIVIAPAPQVVIPPRIRR
jgi:hypothetical protein